MEHIENLCSLLYPSKCCHDLLVDYTLEETCVKTIVTKSLGYGIIFGSTLVKLPQVLKLLAAQSGVGVSLFSVLLELVALTFTSSYSLANSFPISAWGESMFLMLMTALVASLIIYYDINKISSYLFVATYSTIVYILMSGFVPLSTLWTFQVMNLPLIISSKLVQIWLNFKNGHTGNLSAITVIMIFIGSTTRIFTSIQETGDQVIILNFIIASSINLILVLQIFYYWNVTNKFIQKNLSKKKQ